MTFLAAVSRGIGAAHGSLIGAALVFLLFAPLQLAGAVSGATMMQPGALAPPAEGQPPSPALLIIMGLGCLMCLWAPVMVFVMPWINGGIYGQVRDRLTGQPVVSFAKLGGAYYGRMLVLALVLVGVMLLLAIPLWITGAVLGANQAGGAPFDVEAMRSANKHPVNVISGVLFWLAVTAAATLFVLAHASVVVDESTAMDSMGQAFQFASRNLGVTAKLFGLFFLVSIPTALFQQLANLLPIGAIRLPVMIGIAFLTALYIAYTAVLNTGIGVSVFLANRPVPLQKPLPGQGLASDIYPA